MDCAEKAGVDVVPRKRVEEENVLPIGRLARLVKPSRLRRPLVV